MSDAAGVIRAQAVVAERPTAAHARVSAALELGRPPRAQEYTHVLDLQVVPYAAVYLGREGMLGGEAATGSRGSGRRSGTSRPRSRTT